MHSGRGTLLSQPKASSSSSSSFLQPEAGRQGQHEVQFYFDDRFLIGSLSDFVRNALDSGTAAIIVATRAHCTGLAEQLRDDGLDLTLAIHEGYYVAVDASEALSQFMIDGSPDEKLFRQWIAEVISCSCRVASRDDRKVAIYDEMASILWQPGEAKTALRLEELWNQLASEFSFHLRSGYPIASFDRDAYTELFSRICSEHDVVIPGEGHSDEHERSLAVALLQQMEQVLKTEAVERRMAESRAREAQDEKEQLVEELHKHEAVEEELRRFARRLLTARDEEQRRIASELHENTAQLLAALSLYFGVLHEEKASLNPRVAKIVARSRSVSDSLLNEIRKLSHLLHPPTLEDLGLPTALKDYTEDFNHSHGTHVQLEMPEDLGRFDRNLEITVFRIVEEALANIQPRSSSLFTAVRLNRTPSTLLLEIENHQLGNAGSEAGARRERFTGIHERVLEHGGTVQFTSKPTGTRVSVKFPLADSDCRST